MSELSQPEQHPSPPADPPAPRGALGVIFLVAFIDLLGFGLIVPALPFYGLKFKASPLQVSLIFAIFSACQFIAAPILGAMSDRYGRRPVLVISQFGSALGYLLLGFVTQHDWGAATGTGLMLLYLSRIIDGISGGNISTAQAYIADITTRENRAKGMALLGVAFGLGFTLGPALGGIFGEKHIHWPAYSAAALCMLATVLTYLKLPESRIHKPAETNVWLHPSSFLPVLRSPSVSGLLGTSFLCMAAFVMMEASIGLFLHDRFGYKARQTSFFFAFLGIVIIVVQGKLVGPLSKRFGEWALAIGGPLIIAVGMVCFFITGYKPILAILLIGGFCNAAGRSLWGPTFSSLLSKFTHPDKQGVVFGLYWGLSSLARVAGPIVGGLVYRKERGTGPFLVAIGLLLAATFWTWSIKLRHPQPAPEEPRGFEPIMDS